MLDVEGVLVLGEPLGGVAGAVHLHLGADRWALVGGDGALVVGDAAVALRGGGGDIERKGRGVGDGDGVRRGIGGGDRAGRGRAGAGGCCPGGVAGYGRGTAAPDRARGGRRARRAGTGHQEDERAPAHRVLLVRRVVRARGAILPASRPAGFFRGDCRPRPYSFVLRTRTRRLMLYAILCYNDEEIVGSWSKDEDDAVMAKL